MLKTLTTHHVVLAVLVVAEATGNPEQGDDVEVVGDPPVRRPVVIFAETRATVIK